jgi:SAM-dependent methyltransferase
VPNSLAARIRAQLARSPTLRRLYANGRYTTTMFEWARNRRSFAELPSETAVRMAYNVMLRRDPDPEGLQHFVHRLDTGAVTPDGMVEEIRGSEEYIYAATFRTSLGHSIHTGRCAFIQSLPKAARILDLGGTHKQQGGGALVAMGYPYRFDELVIIDLPDELRHAIYRSDPSRDEVQTPHGLVRYRYHSMVDLSQYPDATFDLVYSGQSIEHVTEAEGDHVLAEVHRVLRPGGHLALDTPNGRVTRMQQPEFVDPDHEVEYTVEQLREKLERAGFTILDAKGLNYAGASIAAGAFTLDDVIAHPGLFSEARDCYILTFLCTTAVSGAAPR